MFNTLCLISLSISSKYLCLKNVLMILFPEKLIEMNKKATDLVKIISINKM